MSHRQRKPKIVVDLPKPRPHHHAGACLCPLVRPYIRVSRVGDRKFLISPEIQMRAIEEWAVKNNKRLLDPVCDIDKSGRTFRKRSVDKIIDEVKIGNCSGIVLWKWSRWARNTRDSAVYADRVEKAGGRVHSATEDFDLKTAIGKFTHTVNGAVDELQSDMQSETWHVVHALRREDGLPHGGRERFGYDYVEVVVGEEHRKRYIPNGEADSVRQAYADWLNRSAHASFEKIAKNLNEAGWVTTLGGTWTPQGVARMMDTGFAAGLIRERSPEMQQRVDVKEVGANSIASYDKWRTGSHEAIIDIETWNDYKAKRLSSIGLAPRNKRPKHGLSALLHCTQCRRMMSTKYAGAASTHQWYCTAGRVFHKETTVSVNNRLALEAVREWVRIEVGDALQVAKFTNEAQEIERRRKQGLADRRNQIAGSIKAKDVEVENLLAGVASAGALVAERYNKRIEMLLSEIEDLKAELRRIAPHPRPTKDMDALRALDAVWDELPPPVLQEALSKLVSRIEVGPRTQTSTRTSASDRVRPVGVWEDPDFDEWWSSRPA